MRVGARVKPRNSSEFNVAFTRNPGANDANPGRFDRGKKQDVDADERRERGTGREAGIGKPAIGRVSRDAVCGRRRRVRARGRTRGRRPRAPSFKNPTFAPKN